jgi:exonuclease III
MSLLCWNCRGIGTRRTVCDIRSMVKEKHPNIVFLMETIMRNTKLQVLRRQLGFDGLLTMEPVGKSGGLALLWRVEEEV